MTQEIVYFSKNLKESGPLIMGDRELVCLFARTIPKDELTQN
jgi:hypothetical protein